MTQERLPIEEQEKTGNGVIVEIGPSVIPIHKLSPEVEQQIKGGKRYIAIDLLEEDLTQVKADKIGEAVAGNLRQLPIKDGMVESMRLMNVFGNLEANVGDFAANQ